MDRSVGVFRVEGLGFSSGNFATQTSEEAEGLHCAWPFVHLNTQPQTLKGARTPTGLLTLAVIQVSHLPRQPAAAARPLQRLARAGAVKASELQLVRVCPQSPHTCSDDGAPETKHDHDPIFLFQSFKPLKYWKSEGLDCAEWTPS